MLVVLMCFPAKAVLDGVMIGDCGASASFVLILNSRYCFR